MSQRRALSRERYGLACWTGTARAMETAHAHDEVELNLSAAGPLHYLIGGRVQTLPAGRLGLFWASTPHQLIGVDPEARLVWMTVPLATFLSWNLPGAMLGSLFRNEIVSAPGSPDQDHQDAHDHDRPVPAMPAAELDRAVMLRWAAELGRSPAHAAIVELEARAALHRLALGLDADRRPHDHPGPAQFTGTPVATMADYISRCFREPIRVGDVAAAGHLSPQHAMELFHRTIGLTIGGYLLQCRIAEAQRLLLTSDAPVTRIALDAGFGSSSRFHAAFRAVTGTTPAAYRRTEVRVLTHGLDLGPTEFGRTAVRRLFVIFAVLALLLTAACQGTADAPEEAGGGGFPVTVATKFGDVTIESEPRRVVALGWADAENALALGVQPVGASDWLGFGGEGVGPWAEGRYTTPPTIIGTLEPSYEQIAELAPDLILDTKSSGDPARYERLSAIAPTVGVPEGGDNYLTSADRQTTMIAAALGVPERGEQLLADLDRAFADSAAAHPEFRGKTVTVAAFTSEGWGAYVSAADRPKFLYRLGFVANPAVERERPDGFSVRVSDERLDLLDSDLLIVQPIGKTAADVTRISTFQAIPAVRDGRYLILDQSAVRLAFSLNSPLSIRYALDTVVPLLAERTS